MSEALNKLKASLLDIFPFLSLEGQVLKIDELHKAYDAVRDRIAELEETVKDKNHQLTNALYMKDAYRNMLGENGIVVAKMWDEKNVLRVHYDWTGEGHKLTGEQRAKEILDMEAAADECRSSFSDAKPPKITGGE